MQRQAVLTVRVVVDDDVTIDEAEEIVTNALEAWDLMAHVCGDRIEVVNENGVTVVEE